ncbi:MAG: hypothetical protein HZC55_04975 [Verrucomicrobia bacterium]|nr:hypothetical protein [Verrucomicrobiota bacterium]
MKRRLTFLLVRLTAVLAVFAALTAVRLGDRFALLPNPISLELELAPGGPPRAEPLIAAGEPGRGDFLAVRFVDEQTVVFTYDSWGHPGLSSRAVRLPAERRLRLEVEMPALDRVHRGSLSPSDRVRVTAGGEVVLDVVAHSYPREPERIYFAENPVGGTSCGPVLQGRITGPDGQILRGTPNLGFDHRERWRQRASLFGRWLQRQPTQVVTLLALSLALVAGGEFLLRRGLAPRVLAGAVIRHRWFAGSALIATIGYAWLVTLGTFRFDFPEVFGSFYDHQAASLAAGRLDVPEEAILGEAFVVQGKFYGYFGPTPALLRLPFVLGGVAFGKLSRAAMVAYFVASLLATYLLLRESGRLRAGSDSVATGAPPEPSRFAVVALVVSAGWGSTVLFLGSRGLIFHEAILAGITFALWSAWCSLRHLRAPSTRWWVSALGFGVLSVHSRPPTGLFALTLLGSVALAIAFREHRSQARTSGRWVWLPGSLRRAFVIGCACFAGAVSLNGLAYLKFGVFDPAPLYLSRPYANPARLAAIDGRSMHTANLPFNFYTYLVRPNVRLEPRFPWIYLGARTPGYHFPKAKIDLPDHTLALPYSMPALFALATLGAAAAFVSSPSLRMPIAVTGLAAVPMTLLLFAAVATAQRYTGDFCPPLIVSAALALAAFDAGGKTLRRWLQPPLAAAVLAGVAVNLALTLEYQGNYLWGVPEEKRLEYRAQRAAIDRWFGLPPP